MRYLFLFLVLLLAASPAVAQRLPTIARPDSLLGAQPAADTAAAIHRLFAAKRHQSAIVLSATVGTGLLSLLLAENTRHSSAIDATPVIATGISLLGIPATITEIGYYRQFTRRKKEQALSAFEENKLSDKIKRQLRPAYFEADRSR